MLRILGYPFKLWVTIDFMQSTEMRCWGILQEGTWVIYVVSNCGGFERAQELAREKADFGIQNLKCLHRGSYQSSLAEMLYNTSCCTISLEHRAVAEEL
ncbi:hypothetical protein SADUNF_Sadunf11G0062000 [Salix dunnii]|uniref:Uncharacterized protein n=1 Tax=Salix dunnii TaxID=1413687 RepID=A0A835JTB7_9ROSI|nr:hypothetical protein SADUNF_Sadunf11G0062000 [Salix dunnii]